MKGLFYLIDVYLSMFSVSVFATLHKCIVFMLLQKLKFVDYKTVN